MELEDYLRSDVLEVINKKRIRQAPEWKSVPEVRIEDISEYLFDVQDPKNSSLSIKKAYGSGATSYINGTPDNTYPLRFVCFEEYMNQFVFNDGQGNAKVAMLKEEPRPDLIVYNTDEGKKYFIIQELSEGKIAKKKIRARQQLNAALELLCKSSVVKDYISSFHHRLCIVSAKDGREAVPTPQDVAKGFMQIYQITPGPLFFSFGSMKRYDFQGMETSIVCLE